MSDARKIKARWRLSEALLYSNQSKAIGPNGPPAVPVVIVRDCSRSGRTLRLDEFSRAVSPDVEEIDDVRGYFAARYS
jgi:hypothetical protein